MARHIDTDRFEVEVAYLLPWKDAFVAEIEAQGIAVHCLEAPRPTDLGWLRRLRKLVRHRDIALVHTHMPLPAAQARLALAGRHAPAFVHTEHNLWERYRPLTRWANAATYRRNVAAIAVSASVAASIRSRVPVKTVLHGPDTTSAVVAGDVDGGDGTDHASRRQARDLLELPYDVPVIGSVGNFTAKKDHATLLDAFAAATAGRPPGARLVLVGIGPLEEQLRRQASALGLSDAVIFTGMRDDVFELLAGVDVFVLSSRFEGLPISLLEAMASGVAPVATAVGGIPEVITDGYDGLLVAPGDSAALAAALTKLLDDTALRSGLAAAARLRALDFDLSHAVRTIEAIYERVLEGSGR